MAVFLDRIDASTILSSSLNVDPQLVGWFWVLVDTLNENLSDISAAFNILEASSYTAVEIAALNASWQLDNGVLLFDTTNQLYVGRQGGVLTKFTTSSYP